MNGSELVMICPSRGRPDNALALMNLWPEVTESARLLVVADADDPTAHEYRRIGAMVLNGPRRLGPILNFVAYFLLTEVPPAVLAAPPTHVGFLGDDHRPRTPGWDRLLLDALGGRPGVAYGDDLIQHENLPTACVIDGRLIRALRYMCPPGVDHMYLDNFWKLLGEETTLAYRPDVVIEHMHPAAGKAGWDAGYRRVESLYQSDRTAYQRFLETTWPGDLARLREALAS